MLTLVGVAIITIPWWLRLVRDLGDERRGRVQERERAEIAAHLHDSVLQTLALIQRQAGDSREVQRLARSQERQLRTWLYGRPGTPPPVSRTRRRSSSLAASLAEAAGEVEDTYAIAVTPVIVGDVPMDQHLAALVAAAREAMVNAAKHAEVAGDQRLRRGRGRHGQRLRPGSWQSASTRRRSAPTDAGWPSRSAAGWNGTAARRPSIRPRVRAPRSS